MDMASINFNLVDDEGRSLPMIGQIDNIEVSNNPIEIGRIGDPFPRYMKSENEVTITVKARPALHKEKNQCPPRVSDPNAASENQTIQRLKQGESLIDAWQEVLDLVEKNAYHRKKGWQLQDVHPLEMLEGLQEELTELCDAPDDINEAADMMGIMFNYFQAKGWSLNEVGHALCKKLDARFTTIPELVGTDDEEQESETAEDVPAPVKAQDASEDVADEKLEYKP